MVKNLKNVRLNTAGIARLIFNFPVLAAGAATAIMTIIIYDENAKEEQKQITEKQEQIVESLTSVQNENHKYTIINSNVVRLEENDAKWDFHFASGQAFVIYNGHDNKNETDSIPFSELNAIWVQNAMDTGCSISQGLINAPQNTQIEDEDLEEKLENARNFYGAHCTPD